MKSKTSHVKNDRIVTSSFETKIHKSTHQQSFKENAVRKILSFDCGSYKYGSKNSNSKTIHKLWIKVPF